MVLNMVLIPPCMGDAADVTLDGEDVVVARYWATCTGAWKKLPNRTNMVPMLVAGHAAGMFNEAVTVNARKSNIAVPLRQLHAYAWS